jgi:cytochrome c oxidase subunit 3
VSETILDHGYVPEEHAPDPVTSHGDPTPPGKIGIWLFLASEIMFFIAILGTYIILRSGAPALFSRHAEGLNKWLAGINTVVLILSSVTMYIAVDAAHKGNRRGVIGGLLVTFLCAATFMGIKYVEYTGKLEHHTIVARESASGPLYVYDGHYHGHGNERAFVGYRAPVQAFAGFNINLISERDVHHAAAEEADKSPEELAPSEHHIQPQFMSQDITYGPWKNNFYASYFTATGVHGVHVLGGMIPILFLLVFAARGKLLANHTEYVGLYWHFVDLVWIFLFPLLYLI